MSTAKLKNSLACITVLLVVGGLASPVFGTTYVVKPDGTGDYPTIQAAINAASNTDIIELTDGTFSGTDNCGFSYNGKEITIRSQSGDPASCTIQGPSAAGGGVLFVNDEGRNSKLEYVTITAAGHGIVCGKTGFPPITYPASGSPTITGCVIDGNTSQNGGGMYIIEDSSPYVQQTTISNNTANGGLNNAFGGGVYSLESDPFFFECVFSDNLVTGGVGGGGGGGLYAESSIVWIEECTFADNDGRNSGGALIANFSDVTLASCLLYGNVSGLHGGAVYAWGYTTSIDVDYCTFYGNDSPLGSGFDMWDNASAAVNNTIIAFGIGGGEAAWVNSGGSVTATCTDVYSNSGGDWVSGLSGQLALRNNMQADPIFCGAGTNDFTVHANSPCAPLALPCGQVGCYGVGCSGAMTYTVCPTGTADYTTIQAAINAAADGDTIQLCDATFTGAGNVDVDFGGKKITVESQSGNAEACVIDCAASAANRHRGFVFHSDEDPNSVLRAVKIINGYMTGEPNDADGGGIVIRNASSPTIDQCILEDNTAYAGGGMAVLRNGASPKITDCEFRSNTTEPSFGGGLLLDHSTWAVVYDCLFEDNVAGDDGGGLATFNWVDLQRCTFTGNQTTNGHGGGMTSMASPDVPIISECIYGGNTANVGGGGLSVYGLSGGVIDECTFYDNVVNSGPGGGLSLGNNTSVEVDNCTFHANAAYPYDPNDPSVGGGIYVFWTSSLEITNTIIASSVAGEAVACEPNDATATATCCDIYNNAGGDWVDCLFGQDADPNNISLDPMFCYAAGKDFTLNTNSPCAAFATPNSNCDLIGAWPVNCGVPKTYTVCPTGPADFTTIQAAIDAAYDGDIIQLCDATFTGAGNIDVDFGGKKITVESQSGDAEACIIDCAAGAANEHRGFIFQSDEDPNSVLRAVKIINGYMVSDPNNYEGGGIVIKNASSPTIDQCILEDNTAYAGGGMAVLRNGASPKITDCEFRSNTTAPSFGGGLLLDHYTWAVVHDCLFEDNIAGDDGGGLATFNWVELRRSTFTGNQTTGGHGGGMTSMASPDVPIISECVYGGNTANVGGGGLSVYGLPGGTIEKCTFYDNLTNTAGGGGLCLGNGTSVQVDNCTFHANSAPDPNPNYGGGGIYVFWGSSAEITNTIIASSVAGEAVACEPNDPSFAIATCSDMWGNVGGDWVNCLFGQDSDPNNISLDPLFCNAGANDFTLDASSPCAPFSPPNANCDLIGAWPVACGGYQDGDLNCDGLVNNGDIDPFVLAVTDPVLYASNFPSCDIMLADCNGDGLVNNGDIDAFVAIIGG